MLFRSDPKNRLKQLSTGYTSIYKMITALSVGVDYVLLDEPVLGVDANHRELFYQVLIESYANNPRTFIISTHLIEEAKRLIEEVVIIKNGKIINSQSCEELLKSGYCISGKTQDVDNYVVGKNVIGEETLGGLKMCSILGNYHKSDIPDGLEVTKLDLQKLFIALTNE